MKYTKEDLLILAQTIYGEARGELNNFGRVALIAVANVIVNRVKKHFGLTVSEVCLAPYQFSCWNKNDPNYRCIQKINPNSLIFKTCLNVAKNVLEGTWPDLTDGCDHYHAKEIKPSWALYREPKRIFGNHLFYSLKNVKGE